MGIPAPRKLRRGNWYPGRSNFPLFMIQLAVTSAAFVRGVDYFRSRSEPETTVIAIVQDSPPLPVWGLVFLVGAAFVACGMVGRWAKVIGAGHFICMAAYCSAAWAAVQVTGVGPGVRLFYGLVVAGVIHGALGFSIFGVLRQREELARTAEP